MPEISDLGYDYEYTSEMSQDKLISDETLKMISSVTAIATDKLQPKTN